ncbi:hypothetical protein [Clostridium sp. CF012]|uniref:hypothetical protein n=1 Tax=Clostridium sp. CF012 TaxID=2843319 RepID=UPI001C0B76FA|nr:hypothetical protein [Clostridium sp. CF012]MBU3146960.1 hypothetical protein [Clostridium sp. CF012]
MNIGKFPEVENEVALPSWVLDMINVSHKIGEKVTLDYFIMDKKYSKDFVLIGFWKDEKKSFIVLASLSLSIILFNFIATLLGSFDIDLYLQDSIRGEFTIGNYSYFGKRIFSGVNTVNEKICNELKNIQGIKRIDKIYYSPA